MVMLLLYSRLISQDEAPCEAKSRLEQSHLSLTVLEREGFNQDRLANFSQDIRNVKEVYHLERRFLL